jgi:hypothetical protein
MRHLDLDGFGVDGIRTCHSFKKRIVLPNLDLVSGVFRRATRCTFTGGVGLAALLRQSLEFRDRCLESRLELVQIEGDFAARCLRLGRSFWGCHEPSFLKRIWRKRTRLSQRAERFSSPPPVRRGFQGNEHHLFTVRRLLHRGGRAPGPSTRIYLRSLAQSHFCRRRSSSPKSSCYQSTASHSRNACVRP